MVLEDAMCMNG